MEKTRPIDVILLLVDTQQPEGVFVTITARPPSDQYACLEDAPEPIRCRAMAYDPTPASVAQSAIELINAMEDDLSPNFRIEITILKRHPIHRLFGKGRRDFTFLNACKAAVGSELKRRYPNRIEPTIFITPKGP